MHPDYLLNSPQGAVEVELRSKFKRGVDQRRARASKSVLVLLHIFEIINRGLRLQESYSSASADLSWYVAYKYDGDDIGIMLITRMKDALFSCYLPVKTILFL